MAHSVKTLLLGNYLMAVCGGFYLAWWLVVFRPPKPKSFTVGVIFLVLAFLTGISGFYFCVKSLVEPVENNGIRSLWIVTGALMAYAVLLAVSVRVFHRQVTSELLIIAAWAALELCILNYLYRCGILIPGPAVFLTGVILFAAAASLVCYVLYYRLPYTQSYIDGCIPLILAIVTILIINFTAVRTI